MLQQCGNSVEARHSFLARDLLDLVGYLKCCRRVIREEQQHISRKVIEEMGLPGRGVVD